MHRESDEAAPEVRFVRQIGKQGLYDPQYEHDACGVGMVFLPPDVNHRRAIEIQFEKIIASEGQRVLGWRTVKVNNAALGNTAKRAEPKMRMIFISRSTGLPDDMSFERKLYVIRKRVEHADAVHLVGAVVRHRRGERDRLAAEPDKLSFNGRVIQPDPEPGFRNSRQGGERIEDPLVLGSIIDRDQVAAQPAALGFGSRPGVDAQ